jgi:hypothetical protein
VQSFLNQLLVKGLSLRNVQIIREVLSSALGSALVHLRERPKGFRRVRDPDNWRKWTKVDVEMGMGAAMHIHPLTLSIMFKILPRLALGEGRHWLNAYVLRIRELRGGEDRWNSNEIPIVQATSGEFNEQAVVAGLPDGDFNQKYLLALHLEGLSKRRKVGPSE